VLGGLQRRLCNLERGPGIVDLLPAHEERVARPQRQETVQVTLGRNEVGVLLSPLGFGLGQGRSAPGQSGIVLVGLEPEEGLTAGDVLAFVDKELGDARRHVRADVDGAPCSDVPARGHDLHEVAGLHDLGAHLDALTTSLNDR
jgi:hypothetical protein